MMGRGGGGGKGANAEGETRARNESHTNYHNPSLHQRVDHMKITHAFTVTGYILRTLNLNV